ncbi:MAG TPA: hypothetical protein PL048_08915 [Leptospiraceae bacterium]|nr:hypothetical protein [Leptospiraceae bacterium]
MNNTFRNFSIVFLISSSLLFSQEIGLPFPDEPEPKWKEKDSVPLPNGSNNSSPSENKKESESKNPDSAESPLPNENSVKQNNPSLKNNEKGKPKSLSEKPPLGTYPRGTYHLNRQDLNRAVPEFTEGTSKEGATSVYSKFEMIRLLSRDRKKDQAKTMADTLEEGWKLKAYFEIASGLESTAYTKSEKEESIPFYLQVITEISKDEKDSVMIQLAAKSHWALANLLFKLGDHIPALDHLSRIILDFPGSNYLDGAYYLSGKIYEEGLPGKVRDLERAKKYYQLFLSKKDQYKNSIYTKEVEKRLKSL